MKIYRVEAPILLKYCIQCEKEIKHRGNGIYEPFNICCFCDAWICIDCALMIPVDSTNLRAFKFIHNKESCLRSALIDFEIYVNDMYKILKKN
jgi:hypothetical protein